MNADFYARSSCFSQQHHRHQEVTHCHDADACEDNAERDDDVGQSIME